MTSFMVINKGFLVNSDKNEALYKKQRIVNIVKKDNIYNTDYVVLDVTQNPVITEPIKGPGLRLTQPGGTTITYTFQDSKIYRETGGITNELVSNVSDITFELKKSDIGYGKYIEIKGNLKGKSNSTNIDFSYIIENVGTKWDYTYAY